MSEPDGPRIEVPQDLQAELEAAEERPGSGPAHDSARPAPPASAESAGDAPSQGSAGAEAQPAPGAAELQARLDELQDKYLRLAAEFDNHRRRALRERQDVLKHGNENLIKDLLPSVDNLERAVGHGRREELGGESAQLLEGVELTYRSLLQTLEKHGVAQISPVGQLFDPGLHEAIRQVPSTEHPAGVVAEVFQTGYQLGDRLLRPALVAVSSGPAEDGGD
jgi:molecular chaperone GrpE